MSIHMDPLKTVGKFKIYQVDITKTGNIAGFCLVVVGQCTTPTRR